MPKDRLSKNSSSDGLKGERVVRERIAEDRQEPKLVPRRDVELRREVDYAIREPRERLYRGDEPRVVDERSRVTTNLDPEVKDALDRIAIVQRRTKSEVVREAIDQIAQTSLRNVVGKFQLDEILSER